MNASTFRTAAAIVAAQLVILAMVLFIRGGGDQPLEAFTGSDGYVVITVLATEPGPGPYMGSSERSAVGATSGDIAERDGPAGTFGGYAGDLAQTCDADHLAHFVTVANPDRGATWAAAQGVPVADVRTFTASLSPTILVAPTLATLHSLDADGNDFAEEVVLAPATAVLVDADGNPRVRCVSGAPITPARAIGGSTSDSPGAGFEATIPRATSPATPPPPTTSQAQTAETQTSATNTEDS